VMNGQGVFFGEVEIFMILLLPKPIAFRLIHTGAIGVILCCFFFTLFLFFWEYSRRWAVGVGLLERRDGWKS